MKHPLFSEKMDDRLSVFLIHFSVSKLALMFGFSALFIFIGASQSTEFSDFLNENIIGNALTVYCLVGTILTWLAAQAHSYKIGYRWLVVLIFFLWPIGFVYLICIQLGLIQKK